MSTLPTPVNGDGQTRPRVTMDNNFVVPPLALPTGPPVLGVASPTDVPDLAPARIGVSLVIPTKNEAANIAWVLEQVPECVDEIILVDGRSTDATLVTALSTRPDIQVVMQEGVGKGDALLAGFTAARGDVIVMIDADGSMSPGEIPHYLHFLENGYDFVKGSRFMGGGGSRDISLLRRFGNKSLMHLVNGLFDAQLTDLCYGFCAFHRRYLDYLDLTTPGFEVETKMIISALKSGLRLAEVPSLEMPRRFGRSNLRTFRDGTRVLRTVLREHRTGVSGSALQHVRNWVHRSSDGAGPANSPARS
ncbi:glycosyltransferase family 2 protein [Geodermatophilus sp. SYSU D00742]